MYKDIINTLDNMSKNIRYKAIFLLLLRQESYITSYEIAEIMDVTERTIKSDIKELREELIPFQDYLEIKSKPSKGYYLLIENDQLKNSLKKYYRIYQPQVVDTEFDQRVNYILRRLLSLSKNSYITTGELHKELFLSSNNGLQKELSRVKQILEKYQMTLEVKPHYGMKIKGSFISKSMLSVRMYKYFDKRIKLDFKIESYNDMFEVPTKEYLILQKIVHESIRSSEIVLNDIYAERIVVYMLYLKNIQKKGSLKELSKEVQEINDILKIQMTKEYDFVEKLDIKLSKEIPAYRMTNSQKFFLAMITIMSTDLYRYVDCNVSRYGRLIGLTEQLLHDINAYFNKTLGISIYNDPICYKDLTKLLIPISLKVFLQVSDDVDLGFYNMDIQDKKPILYRYVEKMSNQFYDHYHYQFSNRERYLIFSVLNGMIDRVEVPYTPLKLAIIAINGRLSTQHLKFNLQHHYDQYIETIDTRVLYDLEMEDPNQLDYDYYLCMDYGENMNISFSPIYYADEGMSESDYTESLSHIFLEAFDYESHFPAIQLINLSSSQKEHLTNKLYTNENVDHFILDNQSKVHLFLRSSSKSHFDIYVDQGTSEGILEDRLYVLDISLNLNDAPFKLKIIFEIIDNIIERPEILDRITQKEFINYRDFIIIK